ncbi:MAG: TetR/AcrR family transcriptional regulator [Solirubrobacterales bacterium]|nr:TetR/AcrR family transcriptional regulator [Solirubrobacterales bacterium]
MSAPGRSTVAPRPSASPTRDRLLYAARGLIEEGGYAAASVAAITGRAGLAAGTLYRHFRSKEDLFVEVFRTVCDREVEAMVQAAQAGRGSHSERLETVLSTFAKRALRRPRLAWALLAEPVDPLVDAERLAYRSRYAELIAGLLSAAVAAEELPEQDEALTAAALVGACGEALVGPLSALQRPGPSTGLRIQALRTFVRRAVGAVDCAAGA